MRTLLSVATLSLVLGSVQAQTSGAAEGLTAVEKAAGWALLTGPDAASQWRGYKQKAFPAKGWAFESGELKQTGPGGGDLISAGTYRDLELLCDFKLAEAANSGIIWRCNETLDAPWQTGPEYQLLEDATFPDPLKDYQRCGALYALIGAPQAKRMYPANQWNQARIRIRNGVAQHWLNGMKLAEIRIENEDASASQEWLDAIAKTKFKDFAGFGVQSKGAIALQDHGGGVSFRNFRARDLSLAMPGEVRLFNGTNLDGWQAIVPGAAEKNMKPEDVWAVDGDVLICKGNPVGYIRTKEKYTNFVLRLEWRFNPVTKQAGNSGVLVRMVGEDKVWPKSVEAQLQSGAAGDFWNIDEFKMTTDPERTKGRNTKRTGTAERPIGEWNEYEIIVNKGDVILMVNGEELNRATNVEEVAGHICLQSEGAEIHFRNIRLSPLP